jgi:hypothetical protein
VAEERVDRWLSATEAVLLAVVALVAGWSAYAAATWNTQSSLGLERDSAARTKASRAHDESISLRNFDSSAFHAWFSASIAGNRQAAIVAERRFRPGFRVAFDAWRATKPDTNPNAPRGPTYMPQYRQPGLQAAEALDAQADRVFARGEAAGRTADDYIRTTVVLATILFLVGISARFPLRAGRFVLVATGSALLLVALVLLAGLPGPPG